MKSQLKFVFALILTSLILIKSDDSIEEPVELMTTQEPIDTADDLKANKSGVIFTTSIPLNCSIYSSCDSCSQNNCSWETCLDPIDEYSQCSKAVSQNCTLSACNATVPTTTAHPNNNTTTVSPIDTTTVTPNDTTTTVVPPDTTTSPPDTTTSPSPDTTTSLPPNTTTTPPSPDTTTSPPSPDTTTSPPSPDTTTTTTTTSTTTTPGPAPTPSPHSGGFSAGSFFGGITLTLALIGVGLGGYKFYKTRYDVNYRTL